MHVRMCLPQVKKKSLHSNDFGLVCAGVSNACGYKRNAQYNIGLTISRKISKTYGIINHGSGWRKDAMNQCLNLASAKSV